MSIRVPRSWGCLWTSTLHFCWERSGPMRSSSDLEPGDRSTAGRGRGVSGVRDQPRRGRPPVPGNQVDLLIDGPESYRAMLDAIAAAKQWIHFENYKIRSDSAGWRFAELLAQRARQGVHVRVLYDWFGCFMTSRGYWRYLRDAGVEVRAFHRPQVIDVVTNLSRNHRKLVVADGERAILGGLCIGCEWTGEAHKDGQPWRDTAVDIRGPAAAVLDQTFG